jgi:Rieske Fe-S protein
MPNTGKILLRGVRFILYVLEQKQRRIIHIDTMRQAIVFLALIAAAQAALPVIWQATETVAIFESVNIGNSGRNIVSGKGYNDAALAQIELFNVAGQGTPVWAHQGPDYEVAAAKNADLIAGVSYDATSYHAIGAYISFYDWAG